MFQSLLGFLMRCDLESRAVAVRCCVSIPAGFSDALRRRCKTRKCGCVLLFQSLLGFLMRCDHIPLRLYVSLHHVSIPAGFSDALRPDAICKWLGLHTVSIPAGFSDALRLASFRCHPGIFVVSIPAGFSDALRRMR